MSTAYRYAISVWPVTEAEIPAVRAMSPFPIQYVEYAPTRPKGAMLTCYGEENLHSRTYENFDRVVREAIPDKHVATSWRNVEFDDWDAEFYDGVKEEYEEAIPNEAKKPT